MRVLTSQETRCYASGEVSNRLRVSIQDASGTWRDLTDLVGLDWVVGATWGRQPDDPVGSATVTVARTSYSDSLAPFVETARSNLLIGSYAPLLRVGAEIKIEVAVVPRETAPAAGDWRLVFHGVVVSFDVGGNPAQIEARDLGYRLQQLLIEQDKDYGSDAGVALETVCQQVIDDAHGAAFLASHAYATVGAAAQVRPSTRNGYWYRCTAAGTSGAEPSWPTTVGATVTSGGATFKCMGQLPVLYVPAATGQVLTKYTQKQESVLDAIRNLAALIGWRIIYRWRAATSAFELTLEQPPRSKSTVDFTFSPGFSADESNRHFPISRLAVNADNIRNRVVIKWYNPAAPDLSGQPSPVVSPYESTASMDKYSAGLPVTCIIAEGATSQIRTQAAADAFGGAVLSDLADPDAEQTVKVPLFPWCELDDRFTFKANGTHYTTDQTWAVVAYSHALDREGNGTTELSTRGKPLGMVSGWLQRETRGAAPVPVAGPPPPTSLSVSQVQGGAALVWTPSTSTAQQKAELFEVHRSTSSGFTPSNSTYVETVKGTRSELGNLLPGQSYYFKVVPLDARRNRGDASAEVSVTAGYTAPLHLQPQVATNALPPNPDFEANNVPAAPPDAWVMATGAWGADASLSASSFTGSSAVKFEATAVAAKIASQLFVVQPDLDLVLIGRYQLLTKTVLADDILVRVVFYSDLGVTQVGTMTSGSSGVAATGTWYRTGAVGTAPSGAKYGRVEWYKNSAHAFSALVDSVSVTMVTAVQPAEKTPTLLNSFATYQSAPHVLADTMGFTVLSGSAQNGSGGVSAFVLDAQDCPSVDRKFVAHDGSGTPVYVTVKSTGEVIPSSSPVFFDGIRFRSVRL